MPTTNPRVSITLSPSDLAVLDRFAAASGTPRATVLSELVSTVLPELARAAELMELATQAPAMVREGLVAGLRAATEDAALAVGDIHTVYADVVARARSGTKGGAALPPGFGAEGARPPSTNRGVKTSKRRGKS